jgi:hypothetical protein
MSLEASDDRFRFLVHPTVLKAWCALLVILGGRQLWIGLAEEGGSLFVNVPLGLALLGAAIGLWKPHRWALYALAMVLWLSLFLLFSWFVFDFWKDAGYKPFWSRLAGGLAILLGVGGTLIALHRDFSRQQR